MPPVFAKAFSALLLDSETLRKVLLILFCIFFFLLFLMIPASLLLRIPFADFSEIQIYEEVCNELNEKMAIHKEELGENEEVLPWVPLEYRYLIAIDAVRYNQDFTKVTKASIERLAKEFTVLIYDHTETRRKTYTDEEGNKHTVTYKVKVYRYSTFEDVMNRLGFTDEEKELAHLYSEFDLADLDGYEGIDLLDLFNPDAEGLSETQLAWPLPSNYKTISSKFGYRIHPITGTRRFHHGIDIPAPTGTPVYAPADGTVIKTHQTLAEGKRMIVQHSNGLQTIYCHLSAFVAKTGDKVKKGQLIARVGNTGIYTTGSHLHYETHVNGKEVDPLSFYK